MAGKNYAVRVSNMSKADQDRLKTILEELAKSVPEAAKARLLVQVSGYRNVASYVRAAPGAKGIVDVLGKDSFDLFGGLLATGFQAYEDSGRSDLNGAQRTGRVGVALLTTTLAIECPPLGIVLLGAAVMFPEQYDKITALAFTDRNPLVQGLANVIVQVGGKPFQRWATQPSLIDLF